MVIIVIVVFVDQIRSALDTTNREKHDDKWWPFACVQARAQPWSHIFFLTSLFFSFFKSNRSDWSVRNEDESKNASNHLRTRAHRCELLFLDWCSLFTMLMPYQCHLNWTKTWKLISNGKIGCDWKLISCLEITKNGFILQFSLLALLINFAFFP